MSDRCPHSTILAYHVSHHLATALMACILRIIFILTFLAAPCSSTDPEVLMRVRTKMKVTQSCLGQLSPSMAFSSAKKVLRELREVQMNVLMAAAQRNEMQCLVYKWIDGEVMFRSLIDLARTGLKLSELHRVFQLYESIASLDMQKNSTLGVIEALKEIMELEANASWSVLAGAKPQSLPSMDLFGSCGDDLLDLLSSEFDTQTLKKVSGSFFERFIYPSVSKGPDLSLDPSASSTETSPAMTGDLLTRSQKTKDPREPFFTHIASSLGRLIAFMVPTRIAFIAAVIFFSRVENLKKFSIDKCGVSDVVAVTISFVLFYSLGHLVL